MDLIPSNVRRMLALLNKTGSVDLHKDRLAADPEKQKV